LPTVIEAVDDLIATVEHGSKIHLTAGSLGGPAHAPRLGEGLGGTQERLGWHARVERAFAAHEIPLDQRNRKARLAQTPGASLSAGSCAQHHHVELANVAHDLSLSFRGFNEAFPRLRFADHMLAQPTYRGRLGR